MSGEEPGSPDAPEAKSDALRALEDEVTRQRAEDRKREAAEERRQASEAPKSSDKPTVRMTRRRTSGLVALGLVLLAFIASLFAWPFILPKLQAYLPAGMRVMPVADVASTDATNALSKRLDDLEARVAALPPAATPDDVAALKTQLGAEDAKLADLAQRLDLAQNDQRFADLMKTHEDLSNAIRDLTARVAKLENAAPSSQQATLLALAATRLRIRAENARPFAADLALVQKLAVEVGGLDAAGTKAMNDLAPHAEAGAPSMRDLAAQFPEAARHALKASEVPADAAWWRKVLDRIAALVTIRHTGPLKGDSVEARLSRAEERLNANDLSGAVTEVEALQGKPATKIDPWLQSAYARLAIDRAARELEGAAYRAGANAATTRPANGAS
jgi:hypothetical protein